MTRVRINRAAITQLAKQIAERTGRQYADELNNLGRQYQGGSVTDAKAALRTLHRRRGGSITDPELTRLAEQLVAGGRVEINVHVH